MGHRGNYTDGVLQRPKIGCGGTRVEMEEGESKNDKRNFGDFPGRPVVKTSPTHRACRFDPCPES